MATKSPDDFMNKAQQANGESTAVEQRQPPIVQFLTLYERSLGALLEGTGITTERFRGLIVECTVDQPNLIRCLTTPKGRQSLISSMRKVASLGFEPGGHLGQCWILPSNNRQPDGSYVYEAHVEIGYQGYKDLMYDSGLIGYLRSEILYDTDKIDYSIGSGEDDYLRVKRDLLKPVGNPVAYMIKIVMQGGHEYLKVLTIDEIRSRHMTFTRARRRGGDIVGPWRDHFDSMALKSCILEARKDMPRKISLEIQRGVDVEFGDDMDIPLLETDTGATIDVEGTLPQEEAETETETGGK